MTKSLIGLDDKHILVDQLQMSKDQILETYICNLLAPLLSLIKPYLRDAGFLHVAYMGNGCKLDPTLLTVLVEKWRHETYTFYLPCSECIITLEDVQLQLRLPVDELVVTGLVVAANWKDVCMQLLGMVLDTIYGSRIDMNWLKRNFGELYAESSEVERE
ncbi:hypothetical protein PVK06_005320 [Gossypium arboreum]|uniref:Aminotransferase-like plant mobile domain-containing protein n=1 Tax=Gossypium arboreum TaxID=29729 RepID=A0ABR0QVJ0_GOSAR|nr:hypothetical protein PVK06_005320 [Gossypium arboreum]